MLKPKPGDRILDVGCGPGFLMSDLLGAVGPHGHVVGVDHSDAMCVLAEARLSTALGTITIQRSGAEQLPFAAGSFDAVVFSQVLLYVPDVLGALKEAHRVLRPGGQVLICDTDWDSLVVHTHDKERFERIRNVCCSTFLDPHLPPKLPGMLTAAGLSLDATGTVPMIGAGRADKSGNSFMGNWAFKVFPEKAVKTEMKASEVAAFIKEQNAFSEQGEFFACVHRFLFLASKPK